MRRMMLPVAAAVTFGAAPYLSKLGVVSGSAALGVAVLVCAVLVSLPLLVEADDPLAAMLEATSRRITDPARAALRDAAELRRQVHDVPLDDATASTVAGTWRALRKLAES